MSRPRKELTAEELLPIHKVCHDCKVDKKIERFAISNSHRDGHANRCKDCNAAMHKARVAGFAEERKAAAAPLAKKGKAPAPAKKRSA